MKGFEISYREPSGTLSSTFFGCPVTSPGVAVDPIAVVLFMFQRSHPGAVVLAIRPCKLSDFERRYKLS